MKNLPQSLEAILKTARPDQREALNGLLATIRKIVPEATEGFSYGMPAFFLHGKAIVGFLPTNSHYSYYPMSGRVIAKLKDDLKAYGTSTGGVRVTVEQPLTVTLVRKLLKTRIAEVELAKPKAKPNSKPEKRKTVSNDVTAFLDTLDHALKKEYVEVRRLILSIDPSITEGLKWNAPSFRTTDDFATIHLRSTDTVQIILHTGAKVKSFAKKGLAIDDPSGLLKWLAKDRALCTLGKGKELKANSKAFTAIVKQWIAQLKS